MGVGCSVGGGRERFVSRIRRSKTIGARKEGAVFTLDIQNGVGGNYTNKWNGAVLLDGLVFGLPSKANEMIVINPITGEMGGVDTSHISNIGPDKWCGGCSVGNTHIYGIPYNATQLLVYTRATHRAHGIAVNRVCYGTDPEEEGKWAGGVYHDGKVYGIPYNSEFLLEYNHASKTMRGITTRGIAIGPAKWHGGTAYRENIYAAPWGADTMLCYNTVTTACSGIDVSSLSMQGAKWRGCVATRGRVCCIPNNADDIMIYNIETQAVSGVCTVAIDAGFQKWDGGVAVDGKVYGVPSNSNQMLCLDVEASTVEGITVPTETMAATPRGKFSDAVYFANKEFGVRNIYCIPADAHELFAYCVPTETPEHRAAALKAVPGGGSTIRVQFLTGDELTVQWPTTVEEDSPIDIMALALEQYPNELGSFTNGGVAVQLLDSESGEQLVPVDLQMQMALIEGEMKPISAIALFSGGGVGGGGVGGGGDNQNGRGGNGDVPSPPSSMPQLQVPPGARSLSLEVLAPS